MQLIENAYQYDADDVYVNLLGHIGVDALLKCEGFNFAGSIKIRTALSLIRGAEARGVLKRNSTVVESSSGNLGIALSIICASLGYHFICVVDPRCNSSTIKTMKALGAEVRVVSTPAARGGFLAARMNYVKEICDVGRGYVWLDQHNNSDNWRAHYELTGPSIVRDVPDADVVVIGAGTTGTLMGCVKYFSDVNFPARVLAVDSVGSVTFGGAEARRLIPGLGTGVKPGIFDRSLIQESVLVHELETIQMCKRLAISGYLFGGSTGTALAGALNWIEEDPDRKDLKFVILAPDFGANYVDTIYSDAWVEENFVDSQLEAACSLNRKVGFVAHDTND